MTRAQVYEQSKVGNLQIVAITLTDNSKVYDVCLRRNESPDGEVYIHCVNQDAAYKLFELLDTMEYTF